LSRVASTQQSDEPAVLIGGEPFGRDTQSAPNPVERIVRAAPMTHCLVLHASSALVERCAGELVDVERVSDLDRQGSIVSNTLR